MNGNDETNRVVEKMLRHAELYGKQTTLEQTASFTDILCDMAKARMYAHLRDYRSVLDEEDHVCDELAHSWDKHTRERAIQLAEQFGCKQCQELSVRVLLFVYWMRELHERISAKDKSDAHMVRAVAATIHLCNTKEMEERFGL